MDIENLTENIQSVIECAKAIEYELENNSGDHDEAIQLYETLETHGITTDADEIVASVELVAELSTDDAAEINSALELWESVEGNGHDPDDIEAALEVYAIVENSSVCTSELEGSLKLVEEWDEHCAPTQMDPASMMQTLLDRCAIINVFQDTAGMPIGSVDDANVAVMVMGKAGVSAKEQALLDAIKAFCEPA